jgi:hypothetical protein
MSDMELVGKHMLWTYEYMQFHTHNFSGAKTTPSIRKLYIYTYCSVFRYWDTQFGLLISFITVLQIVTTMTYNTVTYLHNYTPVSSVYLP